MQTESSERESGKYDVHKLIRHKDRPDLILHDSGGFEAGDEVQIRTVGQFVKKRSLITQIDDRLHMIW